MALLNILIFAVICLYADGQTLMDAISGDHELRHFQNYAQKYLKNQLSEPGYTYTVFAPTDEAINIYLKEHGNDARELDSLRTWNYHLLNDRFTRQDFLVNQLRNFSLATLAPKSAPVWITVVDPPFVPGFQVSQYGINPTQKRIHVNQAFVYFPQIDANNGVLHKIDRVLFPIGVGETIWGLILDQNNLYQNYQLTQLRSMPRELKYILDQSENGKSAGFYDVGPNIGPSFAGTPGGDFGRRQPPVSYPVPGQPPSVARYPQGQHIPGSQQPPPGYQPPPITQGGRPVPGQPRQPGVPRQQGAPRQTLPGSFAGGAPRVSTGPVEKLTMFLPNDQAFNLITSDMRNELVQNSQLFEKVLQAHIIRGYVVFTNNFDKSQIYDGYSQSDGVKLHFEQRGNLSENIPIEYYVASSMTQPRGGLLEGDVYSHVVVPNIAVDNGVVHIIDNVLGYIYRNTEETIQTHRNMTKLWTEIFTKNYMQPLRETLREQQMTFFVPSNYAFERIPVQKLSELLLDERRVIQLMSLHMSPGRVYLRNQNNDTQLDTMLDTSGGFAGPQRGAGGGVPLRGSYQDRDRYDSRDRDRQYQDQYNRDQDRSQDQYNQNQQYQSGGGYPYQTGSGNVKKLRFMVIQNGTAITYYVNGDGIWAETLMPNLGTTNGVIHVIDSLLGFPYLSIWQKIEEERYLSDLERYIEKTGFELRNILSAEYERFTVFAPSNEAFREMYSRAYRDYELLTSRTNVLEYVLKTHIVRGQILTIDSMRGQMQLGTMNGKTVTVREDGYNRNRWYVSYGGIEAQVTVQGQAMTNGYIYIINRVLYDDWDLQYTGAGHTPTCAYVLMMLLCVFAIVFQHH